MKITVLGTGYVGLVSGVCYAELGHDVTCIDNDIDKIEMLQNGRIPIYEPGLDVLVKKNLQNGRLTFSDRFNHYTTDGDIVIIAVGTPSLPNGEADLRYIEQAVREIAHKIKEYTIVVIKSTVPVGTNHKMMQIIKGITSADFDIASVPEFLREGTAIKDTLHPDRIVIGAENKRAADVLAKLHEPLGAPIIITDLRSAEMIKYASNAFLATKISFINEIANICEKVGANVKEVAQGMGLDHRIGQEFLKAGIGYGGSCFPKDTRALIQIAGNADYDFKLLKSVVEVNQMQRYSVIHKLHDALGELSGRRIALWGLSFKPGTDDVRESPAIVIANELLELGAELRVYDPVASDNFRKHIQENHHITYFNNEWDAVADSDALCLLTDWEQFKQIKLSRLREVMNSPILIDGRNLYNIEEAVAAGLVYYPVGQQPVHRNLVNEGVKVV
ncbi:UDP-glucose/GDP-mannose dehydrogenase family protein [Paenibacillus timonensis]|uniref:UDP-glucose 6-dehydrogenase n=1 Tax=Paenibacillus timonensis TaxID=225915 RepID=A0ABW3SC23_9BACL|nr:UDP-glucose/GDP-mannose dehydrogenase family protein [Paenibacillus timonensis]MCH1640493.1 UDP-glucose/GDP-mannose dehydrogenase family protein [Paenibacillus timonensis]